MSCQIKHTLFQKSHKSYFLKSLKVSENLWKSLKILENLWKFFELSESLWKFLKTSESLKVSESLRKSLKSLKVSKNIWKSLKIFENLWKYLKISQNLWKSLKVSESHLLKITVMYSKPGRKKSWESGNPEISRDFTPFPGIRLG